MKPKDTLTLKNYLKDVKKQEINKRLARRAIIRLTISLLILGFAVVGILSTLNKLIS